MGAIEETRQVLQDFLAPELREIRTRLDAVEKRFESVDKRFDAVDRKFDGVDRKIDALDHKIDVVEQRIERNADARHVAVMKTVGSIVDYAEVRERLARLESREIAPQ